MNGPRLRAVSEADAEALLAIYAPYVRDTAITFEYEVPSPEGFRRRIRQTLERYPYFCLEGEEGLAGYAYAAPFRSRKAYQWVAETSVYLAPGARKRGWGRLLCESLEEACRAMGLVSLYACITVPREAGDPFVTADSAEFHAHLGYRELARFPGSGAKFGRWYDTVIMEKVLNDRRSGMPEPTWFPQLAPGPESGAPIRKP